MISEYTQDPRKASNTTTYNTYYSIFIDEFAAQHSQTILKMVHCSFKSLDLLIIKINVIFGPMA